MATREYPSVDYVRQCLRYEDGKLFWLFRPRDHFASVKRWNFWNTQWSGKEAGAYNRKRNRYHVSLNSSLIYRHLIVWVLHKNEWPADQLDHINRNSADDRIENLREATHQQNHMNMSIRSNNTSGYKGVSWDAAYGKWLARIKANGKQIHLGRFDDKQEAADAYMEAAKKYFGDFSCDGKKY